VVSVFAATAGAQVACDTADAPARTRQSAGSLTAPAPGAGVLGARALGRPFTSAPLRPTAARSGRSPAARTPASPRVARPVAAGDARAPHTAHAAGAAHPAARAAGTGDTLSGRRRPPGSVATRVGKDRRRAGGCTHSAAAGGAVWTPVGETAAGDGPWLSGVAGDPPGYPARPGPPDERLASWPGIVGIAGSVVIGATGIAVGVSSGGSGASSAFAGRGIPGLTTPGSRPRFEPLLPPYHEGASRDHPTASDPAVGASVLTPVPMMGAATVLPPAPGADPAPADLTDPTVPGTATADVLPFASYPASTPDLLPAAAARREADTTDATDATDLADVDDPAAAMGPRAAVTATVAPEPATVLLVAAGAAVLGIVRRRR
jgi:hypothetical protein